jgi:hypothetical protein
MSKRHRRPCPTATKTPFADRAAADLALAYIRSEVAGPLKEKAPVRSYQCSCGKWHLTSQARAYADQAAEA